MQNAVDPVFIAAMEESKVKEEKVKLQRIEAKEAISKDFNSQKDSLQ